MFYNPFPIWFYETFYLMTIIFLIKFFLPVVSVTSTPRCFNIFKIMQIFVFSQSRIETSTSMHIICIILLINSITYQRPIFLLSTLRLSIKTSSKHLRGAGASMDFYIHPVYTKRREYKIKSNSQFNRWCLFTLSPEQKIPLGSPAIVAATVLQHETLKKFLVYSKEKIHQYTFVKYVIICLT